jgi:3'-phosphoadenosine 5'-phosphosulfate sulfotransferase (PAPS reductase)/FAD synthetase
MKKRPTHEYEKETGKKAILGTMASESRLRTLTWIKQGCNAFDVKRPLSTPMAFWTEQDVLLYVKQNNIPICSVYGDIVEDRDGTDEVEGQLTMSDIEGWENMEMFDAERLPLKTTGCSRTGCMFCMFGCATNGWKNFELIKQTHPQIYDYIMRSADKGGLGMKEVCDWLNEHGNLNIKY